MSTPTEPRQIIEDRVPTKSMHPADEQILLHLCENPPDYIPIVANRLGMHLKYVERRVGTLVELGLVQPVTGEVIYAVTDRGERYLAERSITVSVE